ncbi:hypothetical protein [Streptomyces sp. NPDC007172]|uniref:hypothetical protein n=1 Tax=Streptomyces sp. NPDC007172 TaxID=3364776 RepID=UPI0036BF7598
MTRAMAFPHLPDGSTVLGDPVERDSFCLATDPVGGIGPRQSADLLCGTVIVVGVQASTTVDLAQDAILPSREPARQPGLPPLGPG